MPVVPAICDQCGTVFPSGIFVDNMTALTMTGNKSGPCPRCGSVGSIPDGLYDSFGDTLQVLALTPRSAESLQHLAAVLRSAQRQRKDPTATAEAIEREAPEYAGLAGVVREIKGWTLHQRITLILMVIALLISSGRSPETTNGFTPQEVEQLFHEFVQGHPVLAPSPASSPSPTPTPNPTPKSVPSDGVRPRAG